MKNRYFFAIFLAIIFAASPSTILIAAEKPSEKRDINPIIRQIVDYALPELGNYSQNEAVVANCKVFEKGTASLGASSYSSSPGVTIGYTYFDIQHINTTGRMVGIGNNISGADTSTWIHFTWMNGLAPFLSSTRTAVYTRAEVSTGTIFSELFLCHFAGIDEARYLNLDVTPDNRAIISGHWS